MKQLLVIAILIPLLFGCEKKDSSCDTRGQIIGFNGEECICCSGWTIVFDSDTIKTMSFINDNNVTDIIGIFDYPIDVRFDYKDIDSECPNYKELTCYKIDYPNDCSTSGEIIGYNSTECACCPGWMIATNDDTIKIWKLPQEEIIWEKVEKIGYPIQIQLDYENMDDYCAGMYKKLLCFK